MSHDQQQREDAAAHQRCPAEHEELLGRLLPRSGSIEHRCGGPQRGYSDPGHGGHDAQRSDSSVRHLRLLSPLMNGDEQETVSGDATAKTDCAYTAAWVPATDFHRSLADPSVPRKRWSSELSPSSRTVSQRAERLAEREAHHATTTAPCRPRHRDGRNAISRRPCRSRRRGQTRRHTTPHRADRCRSGGARHAQVGGWTDGNPAGSLARSVCPLPPG